MHLGFSLSLSLSVSISISVCLSLSVFLSLSLSLSLAIYLSIYSSSSGLVVSSCRIHRPPTNESPGYYTKQSDGESSVKLELWGMRSTFFNSIEPMSTPARSGSTWKGLINGLNKTDTEIVYSCKTELFEIDWFDHLTLCKLTTDV